MGWASVSFIAIGNSTIQLSAEPGMRGRVISLWQVAFQGTTPVGGPAIGWIIALTDPRVGLAVGGVSCFAAAIGGVALARRYRRAEPPDSIELEGSALVGGLPAGCLPPDSDVAPGNCATPCCTIAPACEPYYGNGGQPRRLAGATARCLANLVRQRRGETAESPSPGATAGRGRRRRPILWDLPPYGR